MRNVDDVIQVAEGESGEDGSFAMGGLEARRYVLKIVQVRLAGAAAWPRRSPPPPSGSP